MKIRKISIFLAIFMGALITFTSCTKNDGAITNRVTIAEVPAMTTPIDPTGSQSIDLLNMASFAGKFKVDLYFPGKTPPTKVDIVVRKNGSAANVKVFKTGVTTFPSTFTINAAEIQALFGTAIVLGDSYDFAPDIYVGETKFQAFPTTGSGTGAGVIAMPGFSEFTRFSAICAYDPTIYQGNFVVVSDGFGDFSPGEVVALTKVDNNKFSFIDPYVTNPLPIIVTINTLNNQVTIAKQKIGNAFVWNLAYTNPNAAIAASASSFVSPCSKSVNLNIAYTVDQGSFGSYLLVLKKP